MFNCQTKGCLSNKVNGSPNQQSCFLFIRCLLIVLSLVPTSADVLKIPLTSALSRFSSITQSVQLFHFLVPASGHYV